MYLPLYLDISASPHLDLGSTLLSPSVTANLSQAALVNLSQLMAALEDEVGLAFTFEEYYLKDTMIRMTILTMFFGLSTIIAAVAVYILFSKGVRRKGAAVMLTALLIMWLSTVAYWIATVVAAAKTYTAVHNLTSQSLSRATHIKTCLNSLSGSETAVSDCNLDVVTEWPSLEASNIQGCIYTVALMVNVVIADSIVWWRAWVLWPRSRAIHWVCVMMILLTSVFGAMDTAKWCDFGLRVNWAKDVMGYISVGGGTVTGDLWDVITALSSLLTNAVATTLIAYRAWQHRRLIVLYLKGESSARTQVERTFALLIESGILYCALSAVVVVYEFSYIVPGPLNRSSFAVDVYYINQGCAVPVVGMYPTLIIIVCAVDRSLYEKSSDGEVPDSSIVFNGRPSSHHRETLSELLNASPTYATQEDTGHVLEHPRNGMEGMENMGLSTSVNMTR